MEDAASLCRIYNIDVVFFPTREIHIYIRRICRQIVRGVYMCGMACGRQKRAIAHRSRRRRRSSGQGCFNRNARARKARARLFTTAVVV